MDSSDGITDPFADGGVPRLVDRGVVEARVEEGCLRVEGAEVEDSVDVDKEEVLEVTQLLEVRLRHRRRIKSRQAKLP